MQLAFAVITSTREVWGKFGDNWYGTSESPGAYFTGTHCAKPSWPEKDKYKN